MIQGSVWLLLGLLAVAALVPAAALLFTPARARGRREADLALYHAQLGELAREREAGRLDEAGLQAATLEVQRRLLAAPEETPSAQRSGRVILGVALAAVPLLAFGLYAWRGVPDMPSATFAERSVEMAREDAMLGEIRTRLLAMPASDPRAREGWLLIADAERNRGKLDAAAEAYRRAIALGFDAEVTAQLAQVLLEAGMIEEASKLLAESLPRSPRHIGLRFLSGLAEERAGRPENARSVWRALVADAPEGVPWKAMVERRLSQLP